MTPAATDWPPAPGEVRVGRSGTRYHAPAEGMLAECGTDDPGSARPANEVWDEDRPLIAPGSRRARALAAQLRREAHGLELSARDGEDVTAEVEQMRARADALDGRAKP